VKHVALLRGINVGGKHRLPMADLAQLFVGAGCTDVKTYIQSGNVVFSAKKPPVAALEAAIVARFGFAVPIVTRTAAELKVTLASNPLGDDAPKLHVAFLRDVPTAAAIAKLDPNRSPGDVFRVVGRDVYLSFARGAGDTKITATWLDKALETVSTWRNWRTVNTLAAMSAD
jgi:uncharacterized protein (DUF1697 family)